MTLSSTLPTQPPIVVVGAGPAGLTAAYALAKQHRAGVILEADPVVGGIARTDVRDGYRFDIGGHRFFTKVDAIDRLWEEMLGEPMLTRPRLSRIYYQGKFYDYPLRAANAVGNMGLINAALAFLSYLKARAFPIKNPTTYAQWVTNQFGKRLFNMFFKSYTEKVWGISCDEIGADWAAQRIKGLNLYEAIKNALFGTSKNGRIKTLIDQFHYPRLGPGQLWESCASKIQASGWQLQLDTRVTKIHRDHFHITAIETSTSPNPLPLSHLFSSMPLRDLLQNMTPPPPPDVLAAASNLKYRDFITVVLIIDQPDLFQDNWIYIHAPNVHVGRIQNFKNWSPDMVPDPSKTSLGMEYFVNIGDPLWNMPDADLVQLAYQELQTIHLAGGPLVTGYVVRMPKAYPVYDQGYQDRLTTIRTWLTQFDNLHCIGRNGQHRYNNQDHSMATALIAAANVANGDRRDPWAVNEDAEYHEVKTLERATPMAITQDRPVSRPA